MAASLNFTPLTNPLIWFPTMGSFNAFIGSITVSDATTADEGVVKQATLATYIPAVIDVNYVEIANDEVVGITEVPTKAAFLSLKAAHDALATKVVALLAAMETAGQMDLT